MKQNRGELFGTKHGTVIMEIHMTILPEEEDNSHTSTYIFYLFLSASRRSARSLPST